MHQGGIIDTPSGEWWGFSMQDHNSVGRLTSLSPVTWEDGWPYFGLPGNLRRTPSTWVKPNTGYTGPVTSPYDRSDEFSGPKLQTVWQWNHVPDDTKWSLTERPGYLRLHSLPAKDFWWARNSLTQRAMGPESTATTELDGSGPQGRRRGRTGAAELAVCLDRADARRQTASPSRSTTTSPERPLASRSPARTSGCACSAISTRKSPVQLQPGRQDFKPLGQDFIMAFQLTTFQGVRYTLFHYNTGGAPGGQADFNSASTWTSRGRAA